MKSSMNYFVALAAAVSLSHCKSTNSAGGSSSVESAITTTADITDGCYAVGAGGGVLCLSGMNEEGIGGSGAMAAFGQLTTATAWCGVATSISNNGKQLVMSFDPKLGMKSIIFSGGKVTLALSSGTNKTDQYYFSKNTDSKPMFSSQKCVAAKNAPAANAGTCRDYIASCPNGRSPVACTDSFQCADETIGNPFPSCVAKSQLSGCGTITPCVKCP